MRMVVLKHAGSNSPGGAAAALQSDVLVVAVGGAKREAGGCSTRQAGEHRHTGLSYYARERGGSVTLPWVTRLHSRCVRTLAAAAPSMRSSLQCAALSMCSSTQHAQHAQQPAHLCGSPQTRWCRRAAPSCRPTAGRRESPQPPARRPHRARRSPPCRQCLHGRTCRGACAERHGSYMAMHTASRARNGAHGHAAPSTIASNAIPPTHAPTHPPT